MLSQQRNVRIWIGRGVKYFIRHNSIELLQFGETRSQTPPFPQPHLLQPRYFVTKRVWFDYNTIVIVTVMKEISAGSCRLPSGEW